MKGLFRTPTLHLLRWASILIGMMLIVWPQKAKAQTEETEPVGIFELGSILVTAERFEQDAQSVPASLTALDHEALTDGGVETLQDLDRYTPNMLLTTQGSPRFSINSIRGISNTVRDDYFSSTIGVYLDGVPLSAAEFSRRLGDIERVEVLRGPQGTLYGRNTPAGVINMISRAPTDAFAAELESTFGDNGQRGASGMISGPIARGTLSGRLFFDYAARDGFTDYLATGESIDELESFTGSGALRFTPGSRTSMTLSGSTERIDEGAYAFLPFDDFEIRKVDIQPPNREDRDINAVTLNAEHDLGFATLRSISGYRSYEVLSDQDLAYNPTIAAFGGGRSESTETGDQFSQEIRLTGESPGGAFRWLAGGFYQWDEVDYDYLFNVPAFGPASLSSSNYVRQEISGFGEVTQTVLSNWDLTAGVRVSKDRHEVLNSTPFAGEEDFTLVTPKFRVAYRFDEGRLAYAMATRGARSGGFNRLANGDSFDPEYLWSYEAGFKSQWFNRSLTLNGALFHIDWTDQQIRTFVAPGATEIVNAGKSHSEGAELEVGWRPSTGWEITGFLGLSRGEYDEFINSAGMDLAGNTLVNMPRATAGTAIQYMFPLRNLPWQARLRAEYHYTGDQYFDPENRLEQPGYGLVNLRAGIEGEVFSATAFVTNLFDKDYRVYGYNDFLNYDLAIAGASRMIGLKIDAKF